MDRSLLTDSLKLAESFEFMFVCREEAANFSIVGSEVLLKALLDLSFPPDEVINGLRLMGSQQMSIDMKGKLTERPKPNWDCRTTHFN